MFDGDFHKRVLHELHRIVELQEIQIKLLHKILKEEIVPKSLSVEWTGAIMSAGNVALNLSPTAKAVGVVTELNSDGSVFAFDPTKIQAVAQDTTVLTVSVDPATGNVSVVPLKVGTTPVAVQDSATGISATYTFTVSQTGPTPTSLSVSWTATP